MAAGSAQAGPQPPCSLRVFQLAAHPGVVLGCLSREWVSGAADPGRERSAQALHAAPRPPPPAVLQEESGNRRSRGLHPRDRCGAPSGRGAHGQGRGASAPARWAHLPAGVCGCQTCLFDLVGHGGRLYSRLLLPAVGSWEGKKTLTRDGLRPAREERRPRGPGGDASRCAASARGIFK